MYGILIQYTFDGDEAEWRSAIDMFIAGVDADAELGGRFTYSVNTGPDGMSRIHIGRWPDPETHALVQSRDYFKAFGPKVRAFAGDSLSTMQFQTVAATA